MTKTATSGVWSLDTQSKIQSGLSRRRWRQGVEHQTERRETVVYLWMWCKRRVRKFRAYVIVLGHEAEIFNLGLPSMPHVYIFALSQLLRPVHYGPIFGRLAFPAYFRWALQSTLV